MSDGCLERRIAQSPLTVDMDPLTIVSQISKPVDIVLPDLYPIADSDLLSDQILNVLYI